MIITTTIVSVGRKQIFTLQTPQRLSGLFIGRRENATVRQGGAMLGKQPMALQSLLIEKLTEIEENKEGRKEKDNFQVILSENI